MQSSQNSWRLGDGHSNLAFRHYVRLLAEFHAVMHALDGPVTSDGCREPISSSQNNVSGAD